MTGTKWSFAGQVDEIRVFTSWGCPNEVSQTGGLKQWRYCLPVWRPEVQDHDVGRAGPSEYLPQHPLAWR